MVATDRVSEIFADAHGLYESAIERLEAGDIRDAADKAWCAIKRASDALILARTGNEPEKSPVTTRELRRLGNRDPDVAPLVNQYAAARLDFTHFKRHKRGNLQYDGTEWRGVSVHRSWRSIVKNPPTPTTSSYAQR